MMARKKGQRWLVNVVNEQIQCRAGRWAEHLKVKHGERLVRLADIDGHACLDVRVYMIVPVRLQNTDFKHSFVSSEDKRMTLGLPREARLPRS